MSGSSPSICSVKPYGRSPTLTVRGRTHILGGSCTGTSPSSFGGVRPSAGDALRERGARLELALAPDGFSSGSRLYILAKTVCSLETRGLGRGSGAISIRSRETRAPGGLVERGDTTHDGRSLPMRSRISSELSAKSMACQVRGVCAEVNSSRPDDDVHTNELSSVDGTTSTDFLLSFALSMPVSAIMLPERTVVLGPIAGRFRISL